MHHPPLPHILQESFHGRPQPGLPPGIVVLVNRGNFDTGSAVAAPVRKQTFEHERCHKQGTVLFLKALEALFMYGGAMHVTQLGNKDTLQVHECSSAQ